MKLFTFLLISAVLCGCTSGFDYVRIVHNDDYAQEAAFLEEVFLSENFESLKMRLASGADKPAFFIEFFSSWEREGAFGDILVARKYFVPREEPANGRTGTTLTACLEGRETLIAAEEAAPPYVALRVDGLTAGDEGYPLVKAVGLRVSAEEGVAANGRIQKRRLLLQQKLENIKKPLVSPAPELLWIAAGGDMMLGRGASEILFEEGAEGIFGKTAEMLASADVALVNLEGVASNLGERVQKSYNFRFVPEVAEALRGAGIDAVLHANNHVFDYGEIAFTDSISNLKKAGVGVAGAGLNDEEASEPFVFVRGDDVCRVFGIASFPRERNGWDGVNAAAGPGTLGMLHTGRGGAEKIKTKLSQNSGDRKTTVDVVMFHGGIEWSAQPDAVTRQIYSELIEAGADLVIGSHPHVVQGFEWVLGKPVFWSLGNYVFGGMQGYEGGEDGLFIRLGFWRGKLLYLEPFAVRLDHTRTDIAPHENLNSFYERTRRLK